MKYAFILLILILDLQINCISQTSYYSQKTRWISVETIDGEVKCEVQTDNNIKTGALTKMYHWYDRGRLYESQGAYAGYLIHGQYLKYSRSTGRLLEKGIMDKGIRIGIWLKWHDNGNIYEVANWENGIQSGKTLVYTSEKALYAKYRYKNGLLEGKQLFYKDGKLIEKQKFRNNQRIETVNNIFINNKDRIIKRHKIKAVDEKKINNKDRIFRNNKELKREALKKEPIKK